MTSSFRSDWGADPHALVTTVPDTARKRGEAALRALQAALGGPVAILPRLPMTSMMFAGVFDAFPRLKVAYAEAGCGWVPYLAERLDLEYEHRSTQALELKCAPSEHLRSGRIFVHCELEARAIPQAAALLGEDQLFCASDYPHEPKDEFAEAIVRVRARTDVSESLKHRRGAPQRRLARRHAAATSSMALVYCVGAHWASPPLRLRRGQVNAYPGRI